MSCIGVAGPGPPFDLGTRPLCQAGQQCVDHVVAGKQRRARARLLPGLSQALDQDAIQLGAEVAPKAPRVSHERQPVSGARDCDRHRFDSGSSRWARAAATWSARRRASALATDRPCAVIL